MARSSLHVQTGTPRGPAQLRETKEVAAGCQRAQDVLGAGWTDPCGYALRGALEKSV